MIYPIGVAALAGLAYYAKKRRDAAQGGSKSTMHGEMTPKRQQVFETAMNDYDNPQALETLATAFGAEGLPEHAKALRKRARLQTVPPNVQARRAKAYNDALNSKNKQAVVNMANAFGAEGYVGCQNALLSYAEGLEGNGQS